MSRVAIASVIAGIILLATGHVSSSTGAAPVGLTVDADPGTGGVQASASIGIALTFSVDVLISDVADLQAFNFELEYDQTVLSAPTVAAGPDTDRNPDAADTFLTSTSRSWSCSPPAPSGDADPSPSVGAAFISCFSTGVPAGPSDGGAGTVLANVAFDAIAPGISSLTFRNVNTFTALGVETGSCSPTVVTAATCTGATITVPDADGDGVPDASDNCPDWPNAGQDLPPWSIPEGDSDCDGYSATTLVGTRASEAFLGTDPLDKCADTPDLFDERGPDYGEPLSPWPPDTNDDGQTTFGDALAFAGPYWNTNQGDADYWARFDLNGDGLVAFGDILSIIPFFNKFCDA